MDNLDEFSDLDMRPEYASSEEDEAPIVLKEESKNLKRMEKKAWRVMEENLDAPSLFDPSENPSAYLKEYNLKLLNAHQIVKLSREAITESPHSHDTIMKLIARRIAKDWVEQARRFPNEPILNVLDIPEFSEEDLPPPS